MPPTGGLAFIDYDQRNGSNNLPAGQDLATTFACMASVGDRGCGFEQQLESVYQALQPGANSGFLRDDAILAVVWVTDEDDDCSAPPDTDLFDPAASQYGALLSYRGTQYGVECNGQLMPYASSGGPLAGCVPASNPPGKCYDVHRYIEFFANLPKDVLLAGIIGPTTDIESILANPNTQPPGPYVACSGPVDGKTCAVVLQHSCIDPQNSAFFGDPAVRISAVIGSVPPMNQQLASICDQPGYKSALEGIGNLINNKRGLGCIDSPFADASNPDCTVEDVGIRTLATIDEIPRCDRSGGATPCWHLVSKAMCPSICVSDGDPGQHFGITIERGTSEPPPFSFARVECATLAIPGTPPTCGPPI
jgi:hypothetical protein